MKRKKNKLKKIMFNFGYLTNFQLALEYILASMIFYFLNLKILYIFNSISFCLNYNSNCFFHRKSNL